MLHKENETFRRIKAKTVISLFNDIENLLLKKNEEGKENKVDFEVEINKKVRLNNENPILLLDVRTIQEYKQW